MSKIDFDSILEKENWSSWNKINFDAYNENSVTRKWKVRSELLTLEDITPFIDNVRIHFDPEKLEKLKDNIKEVWLKDNIRVYYIEDGNKYIIADWHMRYKSLTDLYWADYETEVIIDKTYETLTNEVELELMWIWFVTSNTKSKLKLYDNLISLQKYLNKKGWASISQKEVYIPLGLWKTEAMRYNIILKSILKEELEIIKSMNIWLSTLTLIFRIEDPQTRILVLKNAESQNLKSEDSINNFISLIEKTKKETSRNNIDNWNLKDEDWKITVDKNDETLEKELWKKLMLNKKPKTEIQKNLDKLKKNIKTMESLYNNLDWLISKEDELNEEEKTELKEIKKLQNILKWYFI